MERSRDMCGTLKFEGRAMKIGDKVEITVQASGLERAADWGGFAKGEYLQFWVSKGEAEPVIVKAETFIEGTTELRVETKRLMGVLLHKDTYAKDGKLVGKSGMVRVLTRPPKNDFEEGIHSRWPEAAHHRGKHPQIYTEEHVINTDDS
jgi:hypothetical protein